MFYFTADFGLAKQKSTHCSKMTSVVGTILYWWYVHFSLLVKIWNFWNSHP